MLVCAAAAGVGWNEHRAMCAQTAIAEGARLVGSTVRGSSAADRRATEGGLVLFSGKLSRTQELRPQGHAGFEAAVSVPGIGLKTQVEMLQCVETAEKKTHKSKVGGGTKTTVSYTHRRAWLPHYENSSSFKGKDTKGWKATCNAENPSWIGLPRPGSVYADSVRVGAFNITADLLRSVPLASRIDGGGVEGWAKQGGRYVSEMWVVTGAQNKHKIGWVRVSFFSNDWGTKEVTVLGKNDAGRIMPWEASPTWLCSGSSLFKLRMKDTWTKDAFFEDMRTEESAMVWVCRVAGLAALWVAFGMMAGPVSVLADCVPGLGPKLGDAAESVACFLAVLPAGCCCLLVVGLVWIVLYPLFGTAALALFAAGCVCGVLFRKQQRRQAADTARCVLPLGEQRPGNTPLMRTVQATA